MKKKVLGQGLASLLGEGGDAKHEFIFLSPQSLSLPPSQPRTYFDPKDLQDLAQSIKNHGVLQPLLVRPDPKKPGIYQLVAGERRLQASRQAQLSVVPCRVLGADDVQSFEWALLENIQRADLTPLEEAKGYRHLMAIKQWTQESLATSLGKSRSHIANLLRLLNLPQQVQNWIHEGRLSSGHGKLLVGMTDAVALAQMFIDKAMTVRQAEAWIRQNQHPSPESEPQEWDELASAFHEITGLQAKITMKSKTKGHLRLAFTSTADLDRLLSRLYENDL